MATRRYAVADETGREHVRNAMQVLGNLLDGLTNEVEDSLHAAEARLQRAWEEYRNGNW